MSFLNLDLNLLRIFDAIMIEQNLTRRTVSGTTRNVRDPLQAGW
jgi:hypothetical protein